MTMQALLLGLLLGVSAVLVAYRESAWSGTAITPPPDSPYSSPLPSPAAPAASPVAPPLMERPILMQGAAFTRSTARVATNGFRGPIELRLELPTTIAGFQQGLMGGPALSDSDGMLFVMASQTQCSFWMKDTPSPLSIAFIGLDGRIFDIQDMAPNSLDIHNPGRACTYALEVAQGWFVRNNVGVGAKIDFAWPSDQPPSYHTS